MHTMQAHGACIRCKHMMHAHAELQEASLALFNRKMLKSVMCAGRMLVANLSEEDVDAVFRAMHRKTYGCGDVIASKGEIDEALCIIESGEVTVAKDADSGGGMPILTLKRGDCFGEQALVTAAATPAGRRAQGARRKSSIIVPAGATSVVTLKLTPQTFQRLRECASLDEWATQLVGDIGARAAKGVDAVGGQGGERHRVAELAGPDENAAPPPGRRRPG